MTEMFGEAWSPMSVPDLAPDDDDDALDRKIWQPNNYQATHNVTVSWHNTFKTESISSVP